MKRIKAAFGIVLVIVVVFLGNSKLGMLPPVAKFLDPYHGFWQNSELETQEIEEAFQLDGIETDAKVVFDNRGVPHIFASNDHDLYFIQGYLTAKDRLWQMEFQTHAAAGRLCEIVGKRRLILT